MTVSISVRSNIAKQSRQLEKLRDNIKTKAVRLALNKTIDKGKAEMTRAITSEFNIKADRVRSSLFVKRASSRGLNLVAFLGAFGSTKRNGRSLNLINFVERKVSIAESRRRKKRGTISQLGFKIKKKGGVKQIKGMFIGNKGRTVFRRLGRGRLPIAPGQVIDVPQMFNTRRINQRVVAKIMAEFPVELTRAINLLLKET